MNHREHREHREGGMLGMRLLSKFYLYLPSLCSLCSLWFISSCGALQANEDLNQLDALIQVTQQNLKNEMALRDLVKNYLELQEKYLQDTENKELLLRVARQAVKVADAIKESNLAPTFSSSFLSELTLFAQIGQKRGIPKP